ncbi:hypothetical protein AKJ51_00705 [candidate division MSBL1 archaeon SCGC-AAA382A20]|uniref:Helicase HerA central domain-containing protein n=1 Tax=candidate division MSBL1 archaeon SCGC-AAA382A20 TaxID=1698280 RepID=A0A133VMI1_9EURY|nr:hypothetical protein AKJ51_00705 [candidate division MSBL1 archaeon SCGC-AAA382A20]
MSFWKIYFLESDMGNYKQDKIAREWKKHWDKLEDEKDHRLSPPQIEKHLSEDRLRFGDNPSEEGLLREVAQIPEDMHLQEMAQLVLNDRMAQSAVDEDPYRGNYPGPGEMEAPEDFCRIGTMGNGVPLGFSASTAIENIGIFGRSGAGKTCLVKVIVALLVLIGFRIIIFARKRREYDDLAALPPLQDKSTILPYRQVKYALTEPPPGVPRREWDNDWIDSFGHNYGRYYAQRLLQEVFKKPRRPETLRQAVKALKSYGQGYSPVVAKYRESIQYSIASFLDSVGDITDYKSSNMLSRMFEKPGLTVIEMEGLSQEPYSSLSTYPARWLYMKRQYQKGSACQPPVLFVWEDATLGMDRSKDRNNPQGTSPLAELSFMGRRYRQECLFVGHHLRSVSPKILSNVHNIFILGLPGENPREISQLLGTDKDQTDLARVLGPGELLALSPSIWPEPVYGTFDRLNLPSRLSDQERQKRIDKFLSKVDARKASGVQTSEGEEKRGGEKGKTKRQGKEISSEQRKLLLVAATNPERSLTGLYSSSDLSRRKGAKTVKKLEKNGLATRHRFSTGGRGGRVTLLEVTDHGWERLKKMGVDRPDPMTAGGWEHQLGARLIQQEGRKRKFKVDFEVDLGPVQMDVKWRSKQGQIQFFNIGISRVPRESKNALKAVQLPAVKEGKFTLVCRDTKFRKKVSKKLKKLDPDGNRTGDIELKIIADFLNSN